MSQNQSNSSVPSNDELEHFNKCQLLSFLKSRGNKDILLKVAKLVANRPVITVTSDHTTSLTINSVLEWKNAATEVAPIPKGFNLETLTNYLREIPCNLAMQDEEELVYSGTQKPVLKGRKMYQSMKLQMAQFGVAGTAYLPYLFLSDQHGAFRIALSCPPFCLRRYAVTSAV